MKKILTPLMVMCMALSMNAAFHLTIEKWIDDELVSTEVTGDTTLVVTEYEYDEDLEEAEMGVTGKMYSDETDQITVTITRTSTGILDQFCAAGNCIPGNGELTQVCEFTVANESMRVWFTHYTPATSGQETIAYTFDDGKNPKITMTVVYDYNMTSLENVVAPQYNGKIYNLLGQQMSTTELSELPKGIYIINGKKYIKQ